MPVSEFDKHLHFWENWKWGMQDDMIAIDIVTQMKIANHKTDIKPWQVKQWTLQRDYSWRTTHLIMKPVAAIRSGFMTIVNAMKSMGSPK